MWEFFQRRICLTTKPEEWEAGLREFNRVGLTVEKFQSLPDIGPHQSFSKSIRNILIDFYESDAETLLHLEDDCIFKDLSHLETALRQLPSTWDILYLGANLVSDNSHIERFSENLFKVDRAWTTHAVGYSKKVIPYILENQPGYSDQMYDNWLSAQLKNFQTFIIAPMVAYQRPRISSIWDRFDDYTPIFEESDARLRC